MKVKVAAAIKRYDIFNRALTLIREAIDFCSPLDLKTRDVEQAKHLLEEAALIIEYTDYYDRKRIVKYLKNRIPGLLLAIKSCNERLNSIGEKYGNKELQLASTLISFHYKLQSNKLKYQKNEHFEYLLAAHQQLIAKLGKEKASQLICDIEDVLKTRYRASSPIEGINAALRPYLYCRKNVSQIFLDLYRFYYNRKIKRWGNNKGRSAYEQMTGKTSSDWLNELGFTLH